MKKEKRYMFLAYIGIFAMVIGIVLATLTLSGVLGNTSRAFTIAGVLFVFGMVVAQVSKTQLKKADEQPQNVAEDLQNKGIVAKYIPQQQVGTLAMYDAFQSQEDKFDQIALMDKTQFVVYTAKLFSYNGYMVKLTSVVDNYGVDFLAEKDGERWAISCILANKVLSSAEITGITAGQSHYAVNGTMVVSNSYFDRSANVFARENNVKLVDRSVLSKEFMH